jgi:hypothetical protein
MRQMMRQLTSSGLFGGGGLKSKMLRKMTGMPDMAGFPATVMRCRRYRLRHQERN